MSDKSLLLLDDDSLIKIFQILGLMEHINLGSTCRRLRNIAADVSRRKYKKIVIKANLFWDRYAQRSMTIENILNALAVIGSHVLEAELYDPSQLIVQSIVENCQQLKTINLWSFAQLKLTAFHNLKKLKVHEIPITTNEWKIIFANNHSLESLDYNVYYYQNGFIETLTMLPQLKSIGLPYLPPFFHQHPDFQHLLSLVGLKKLNLRSRHNCNDVIIELSKALNLIELEMDVWFDKNSFKALKLLQNTEVWNLKLFNSVKCFELGWKLRIEDSADFPHKLREIAMYSIRITCTTFLNIVKQLMDLVQFDIDNGQIYWDKDESIGLKDPKVICRIEDELRVSQRRMKIHYWDIDRAPFVSYLLNDDIFILSFLVRLQIIPSKDYQQIFHG